jgi:hypothetical protein
VFKAKALLKADSFDFAQGRAFAPADLPLNTGLKALLK